MVNGLFAEIGCTEISADARPEAPAADRTENRRSKIMIYISGRKNNVMSTEILVEFSNRYGKNPAFVLAGGGNTSCKTADTLWIKGSGTSLAAIKEEGFVKMDRAKLAAIWKNTYSADQAEREAAVLADMMAARLPGEEAKRPSVETLLHDLFPQTYVLHVHPSAVNALTCSAGGESAMKAMFPDAVWVNECEPGYILAANCREKLAAHKAETGSDADVVFLQNHGIFFAADDGTALDAIVADVMNKIDEKFPVKPDFAPCDSDRETAAKLASAICTAYDPEGTATVIYAANPTVMQFAASAEAFEVLREPLSPDHIVYCKAEPLYIEDFAPAAIRAAMDELTARRGFKPKIVFAKGIGMFAVGANYNEAKTALEVWQDAMTITTLAEAFGGVRHMAPAMVDFIVNWEVESYRAKVSLAAGA